MEASDWFRKFENYMAGKETLFPQQAEQAEIDALAAEHDAKKRALEAARQKRKSASLDPRGDGSWKNLKQREIGKDEYWHN